MLDNFVNKATKFFEGTTDKQAIGIGGLVIGARISEAIELTKQAPDVPLENGSKAQDHFIKLPVKITIEGYIGDIDYNQTAALDEFLRANRQIAPIVSYLPDRTESQINKVNSLALSARDLYKETEAAVKAGQQVFQIFKPSSSKSLVAQFFEAITELHDSSLLIDIQTSFGTYKNMAVIGTNLPRDLTEDPGVYYSLTCKQIVFAEVMYSIVAPLISNPSSSLEGQADGEKQVGENTTKDVDSASLIHELLELVP